MKILQVHNYYQQHGGEEIVLLEEKRLLEDKGHQVILYSRDSSEIKNFSITKKLQLIGSTQWSKKSYKDISAIIRKEKPHIAHFHNILPLISPSGYQACKDANIPVIQTLHNYRIVCPSGFMFREGVVCELCLKKSIPLPGIRYGCYRNSRLQTGIVATMLTIHRFLKTWETKIDAYIALSNFAKNMIVLGGIPPQKIFIKPNFVSDPGKPKKDKGDFAIYVGRLSQEKGILNLVRSWLHTQNTTLRIIGDGPLRNEIQKLIKSHGSNKIELLGWIPYSKVLELIPLAAFLIFPTQVYETFGRVVIEAYSCGIPVVASRIGAVEELVTESETGLLFDPYNTDDMISKINWMITHPEEVKVMGEKARKEYERLYTPEKNYHQLMKIYESVMKSF